MKFYPPSGHCQNCFYHVEPGVLEFSLDNYSFALCVPCQHSLKNKLSAVTDETRDLYFSLKKRNVHAILEKSGGDKKIDIAVMDAKVNIEIDGSKHHVNPRQAFLNLKKGFYSIEDGCLVLRIPNTLIREKLDETADYIRDFLVLSKQRKLPVGTAGQTGTWLQNDKK